MKEVEHHGWIVLPRTEPAQLLALAHELGVGTEVRWLRTQERKESQRRSLSSLHGRSNFPPHTDGATRLRPPRFVALLSERSYRAATLLFDGGDAALAGPEFSRSWLVSDVSRRFYVVPRRRVGDRLRWRLNPDVMAPAGDADQVARAMEPFSWMAKVRIEWEPDLAVIWDNHRMLHAREAVGSEDGERALLRVSVCE